MKDFSLLASGYASCIASFLIVGGYGSRSKWKTKEDSTEK
jgi:hypothetical protein